MKFGPLFISVQINVGSGRRCVDELARSLPLSLEIGASTDPYKRCHSFSDFWDAYALVFPKETHRCVGKDTGETNHMERWNNTLRQSNARYVRKTLSFSKLDFYHELVTRLFIVRHNLNTSLAI